MQGRNWMALAILAPGSRTTPGTIDEPLPDRNGGEVREFQLHIDGQQVTQDLGTGVQPRYSQDSIAEFQFISNRFDATMGRSSGVQVKAITRSGTNAFSGLFRGNFRDDTFNAEDPVVGSGAADEQSAAQHGDRRADRAGPAALLRQLRVRARAEDQRLEHAVSGRSTSRLTGKEAIKMGGGRLDYQLSPNNRIMGKWHEGRRYDPFTRRQLRTIRRAPASRTRRSREVLGQLTQVFGNTIVNEAEGRATRSSASIRAVSPAGRTTGTRATATTVGSPRIRFSGFDITPNANWPRTRAQDVLSVRDDLTLSYEARGRHDLRTGVEYLHRDENSFNRRNCRRRDRRPRRAPAGQSRADHAGSVQRRHVEPGGALVDYADRTASASATSRSITRSRSSASGCRTTGRSPTG